MSKETVKKNNKQAVKKEKNDKVVRNDEKLANENKKQIMEKTKKDKIRKDNKKEIIIETLKNNKKKIFIGLIALFIVVLIIVLSVIISNMNEDKKQKQLVSSFETMGIDFYENFYYKQIGNNDEEISKFLKKFETIGIKVSLDNLSRYKTEENKEVINQLIDKCDKTNTKIVIYPQEPYKQKSYRMETKLECDFEKK